MARLRRLFSAALPEHGGEVDLPLESVEHAQVLRLNPGDRICLFDGAGREAAAEIVRRGRGELVCRADPPLLAAVDPGALSLIVCLPKAGKLEEIVRMTTELGVRAISLATSERTVPKPGLEASKLERLRRVAREACAQSGQPFVPRLSGPRPLPECAAAAPPSAAKLAFWEEARAPLPAAWSGTDEVWTVVGPEGGLSANEAALLERLGYRLRRLGTHILRVETACVVSAALLLDRMRTRS